MRLRIAVARFFFRCVRLFVRRSYRSFRKFRRPTERQIFITKRSVYVYLASRSWSEDKFIIFIDSFRVIFAQSKYTINRDNLTFTKLYLQAALLRSKIT